MTATLLIAAHGTVSPAGSATTRALADAVAAARPDLDVRLCFLDVVSPRLDEALDDLAGDVVVVPLLLSAGYHVTVDIPRIVSGRPRVRVAPHLGPDPLVVSAVAFRLAEAGGKDAVATVLAAVSSSRSAAHDEVEIARAALEVELGRPVTLLPLTAGVREAIAALPTPVAVAVYLLGEGAFVDALESAVEGRGVVAMPIGVHPNLVELVLARYDAVALAGS